MVLNHFFFLARGLEGQTPAAGRFILSRVGRFNKLASFSVKNRTVAKNVGLRASPYYDRCCIIDVR